jgi:hypothetical protein
LKNSIESISRTGFLTTVIGNRKGPSKQAIGLFLIKGTGLFYWLFQFFQGVFLIDFFCSYVNIEKQ